MDKGGPKGSGVKVAGDPSWLRILLEIPMNIYDKDLAFQLCIQYKQCTLPVALKIIYF